MNISNKKIFAVTFGTPTSPGIMIFGSDKYIHVVADNIEKCAVIAQEYLKSLEPEVLSYDGSISSEKPMQIKNISIISEEVIY